MWEDPPKGSACGPALSRPLGTHWGAKGIAPWQEEQGSRFLSGRTQMAEGAVQIPSLVPAFPVGCV